MTKWRGEEVRNNENIMMKNEEGSCECDEQKNDDDGEQNEDAMMIKRKVQKEQNGDDEVNKAQEI